ncbi:MAG TPA: hypothetical protein VLG50_04330 [Candidatus Saccharimonadales bacterium]|nr:hypothetical protein [Candidatus Saccharimonadales bacterium]
MDLSIKKIILIFSVYSTVSLFSGIANGLTNNTCSTPSNSQTCALQFLGNAATTNTLLNLATQIQNYVGSGNATNLFSSLNTLAGHIKNGQSNNFIADINIINSNINVLIAEDSGTPNSTWMTWFQQFIKLINVLFGINAPYNQMTSEEVVNAINMIPAFSTQVSKINQIIATVKSDMTTIQSTAKQDGYNEQADSAQKALNDIINIQTFFTNYNGPKLNGAIDSFFGKAQNIIYRYNKDIAYNIDANYANKLNTLKSDYNSMIDGLISIGYLQNATSKRTL